MDRIDLLREAIAFYNSPLWKELIGLEKQEKIQSLINQLLTFESGRDEFDDYLRGQIAELKYDFTLKDIYMKELNALIEKK